MTAQIRDFIEVYKTKPAPPITVEEFIKTHNHEIWRKCQKCGAWEDLRKNFHCKDCGQQLDPDFK